MTVNIKIGNYVIMQSCSIGHDAVIGDYATISPYSHILGNAVISQGAFLGTNSVILPHTVVEDNAYVGAGSIVLRRVKAGTRVFGNPAREMDF